MYTTNLRKVGGSSMLAVPPTLLEMLGLVPGSTVGLTVERGRLIVERKPGYTLDELLSRCDAKAGRAQEDRAWLDGGPTGEELL